LQVFAGDVQAAHGEVHTVLNSTKVCADVVNVVKAALDLERGYGNNRDRYEVLVSNINKSCILLYRFGLLLQFSKARICNPCFFSHCFYCFRLDVTLNGSEYHFFCNIKSFFSCLPFKIILQLQ